MDPTTKRSTWTHSCPTWILGPRSAHPKFGGGVIINGILSVSDRLTQLHQRFPQDLTSAHNLHEVAIYSEENEELPPFNSPYAISKNVLGFEIEGNDMPRFSAFTHPAFGYAGAENGAILNPDPKMRELAVLGHRIAIARSLEFKKRGIGLGHVIWWPAFDSRHNRGPLAEMSHDGAWLALQKFWIGILKDSDAIACLEYKPSVPGVLDFIPTMRAAIDFCQEVNLQLGRRAMVINLEWAHALIGGQTVCEATVMQLKASLFGGLVHVNSAELAQVDWSDIGLNIISGAPGDDKDWAVGEGGRNRWDDQQQAVALLDSLGVEITAEHDIDPAGEDPFECYGRSRANLEKMIANIRGKAA